MTFLLKSNLVMVSCPCHQFSVMLYGKLFIRHSILSLIKKKISFG